MNETTKKRQIKLLDLIKLKLLSKKSAKKVPQYPVNTIPKKDGWLWIVDSSTYKASCNDYWLFLRPFITKETEKSISLFESRLSQAGFKVFKKGVVLS